MTLLCFSLSLHLFFYLPIKKANKKSNKRKSERDYLETILGEEKKKSIFQSTPLHDSILFLSLLQSLLLVPYLSARPVTRRYPAGVVPITAIGPRDASVTCVGGVPSVTAAGKATSCAGLTRGDMA